MENNKREVVTITLSVEVDEDVMNLLLADEEELFFDGLADDETDVEVDVEDLVQFLTRFKG